MIIVLSKVYTRRTSGKVVILQSCLFDLSSKPTSIIADKEFSLFHECAARCAHLSLQKEECTFSSWFNNKINTSATKANLQRILTKIIKSEAIAKVKVLTENDAAKHLKVFTIISIEMLISLLILCWWYFSSRQMYSDNSFNNCFYELKTCNQIFVSTIYRSVDLKNNSLRTVYIISINKLRISWTRCFNILTQICVSKEWEQI